MAEQGPSLGFKKLEEQLTCPVCFDCYDNPKTLPCLHSFCLKCIQQLPVDLDEAKYQISCPTCRKMATLPPNGVPGFPSAFVINSFLEIQELLKKVNVGEGQQICCGNCQVTDATRYCKECATVYCEECLVLHNKLKVNISHHITDVKDIASNVYSMKQEVIMNCTDHNKPFEIFCETCQDLVCRDCIVRRHRDHDYDIVTDVFPKHRQEIKHTLEVVKQKITATNDVLKALMKREKEITDRGDDEMRKIHLYAQQIIESVQQCEQFLVQQVDASVQCKLRLLGEQVKEAETALVQLKSCEEYIEQSLEVGSPQQILLEKQRMIQGMEVASEQINPEVFQPVEEADITFTRNKALVDSCKDIGKVKCLFSYPPSKPRKVVKGLDWPQCVAVNSEGVMVVGGESDNCITVINKDGEIVRSFGLDGKKDGQYGVCDGIAFTADGHIVVSDYYDSMLYKLTLQGEYIASVGGEGSGPLEFDCPFGIAVHPTTGQIYIADSGNHRIQVINNDFTYSHSIGSEGTAPGQLQCPTDVALDSAGNIYVCDNDNTSINVFTLDGMFIRQFGSRGSSDEQTTSEGSRDEDGEIIPDEGSDDADQDGYIIKSVAVDRYNQVYVVDHYNNCISIFTSDGQFIKSIGSKGSDDGQFDDPCGITVDAIGNLYIVDTDNNRLVIY